MKGLGRFPSLIENLSPEMNAKRLGADRFKMLGGEGADLPAAHIPTLVQAREAAQQLFEQDPLLSQYPQLWRQVDRFWRGHGDIN